MSMCTYERERERGRKDRETETEMEHWRFKVGPPKTIQVIIHQHILVKKLPKSGEQIT
jgi:hypothetical protein